jgi:phosphoribosylglycinamide formyltransferase 1
MNNFSSNNKSKTYNIAIFASGSGTNAENIYHYFQKQKGADISLILTNKSNAFVIQRAKKLNIPICVFDKDDFYKTRKILDILIEKKVDLIVLAGFLWLIPENIIKSFEKRIINIHPALLPHFGGKGMYGDFVHKKVIETGQTESGITIHYVNEHYDDGDIIFQAKCKVEKDDTPETLAKKIHELEYENYPRIVEEVLFNFPLLFI